MDFFSESVSLDKHAVGLTTVVAVIEFAAEFGWEWYIQHIQFWWNVPEESVSAVSCGCAFGRSKWWSFCDISPRCTTQLASVGNWYTIFWWPIACNNFFYFFPSFCFIFPFICHFNAISSFYLIFLFIWHFNTILSFYFNFRHFISILSFYFQYCHFISIFVILFHFLNMSNSTLFFTISIFPQKPRWYYTSDTVVKETTIDEVLSSSAYLLYYDRGTGPSRQPM